MMHTNMNLVSEYACNPHNPGAAAYFQGLVFAGWGPNVRLAGRLAGQITCLTRVGTKARARARARARPRPRPGPRATAGQEVGH